MSKGNPASPGLKADDPLARLVVCERQIELILHALTDAGYPCPNLARGVRTRTRTPGEPPEFGAPAAHECSWLPEDSVDLGCRVCGAPAPPTPPPPQK